jgi:hypothetical protein
MLMFASNAADAIPRNCKRTGRFSASWEFLEKCLRAPSRLRRTHPGPVRASAARLFRFPDHRWNATYGATEYGEVTADVSAELDLVSHGISEEESTRVRWHLRTTNRNE